MILRQKYRPAVARDRTQYIAIEDREGWCLVVVAQWHESTGCTSQVSWVQFPATASLGPRPKTDPSVDRFKYCALCWKQYTRRMRSGDETKQLPAFSLYSICLNLSLERCQYMVTPVTYGKVQNLIVVHNQPRTWLTWLHTERCRV